MEIRAEQVDDIDSIHRVNVAAFGRENEADLVDRLRGVMPTVSLVAVDGDKVVGHIFFSPVTIAGESAHEVLLGLAPVAVMPEYQRNGVGTSLINQGVEVCTRLGVVAIVVLGAAAYYQRFGFIAAKEWGLGREYDVLDDSFMALELFKDGLKNRNGIVRYRPEFSMVE
jgi:putative acetyltransferase